jgi:hypothetical protein
MSELKEWLADTNFFSRPTPIRRVQCWFFGHRMPNYKMDRESVRDDWCAWCGTQWRDFRCAR